MAEKEKELSRIYQGRVTGVCLEGRALELSEGEKLLWQHHVLFQDAVNYYTLALAAMATDENSPVGRMRKALENVWTSFRKNGVNRSGMETSLARTLGVDGSLSMSEAMARILEGNDAPKEMLQAAVTIIAEKCEGNVQQPGATCFSQLCNPDFTKQGNFDFDAKAKQACIGSHRLMEALESEDSLSPIQVLSEKMQIDWCGIKTQPGKLFSADEVQTKIAEAIAYFLDVKYTSKTPIPGFAQYLQLCEENLNSIQCSNLQRNATGPKNDALFYAFFLAKFFPSDESVSLLKNFLPGIRSKCKDLAAFKWDDDPIKLSRCARGYVFRAFTAFMFNKEWKDFDILAFTEALKTLNQFKQKTDERDGKLAKYQAALEWMNGESSLKKAPSAPDSEETDEEEEQCPLPVLDGDSRWEKLQVILRDELKVCNSFTEEQSIEYGLSQRTIRETEHLFKEWNELLKKERNANLTEKEISRKLIEYLNTYQAEHSETIGSVNLFRILARPEYFCIWQDDWKEPGEYRSSNLLRDAVLYFAYREEAEFLEIPIQITPADPKHSRRLSDMKALSPTAQDKKLGKMTYKAGYGFLGEDTAGIDIAVKSDVQWTRQKVEVHFSAPRLKRDGLLYNEHPVYCPPVVQAWLDKQCADSIDIQSTPIQLMPDFDKNGHLRILLNFPVKLSPSAIQACTSSRFDDKQFISFGKKENEEKTGLAWPGFAQKKSDWGASGQPFEIVSVDLGQRTAGACARIRVSTEPGNYHIFLGNDGSRGWYAYRKYAGLLRLPGEDCTVLRNGKRQEELSGAEGRLASQAETREALELCAKLLPGEGADFLQIGLSSDGRPRYESSFPRQNDSLLKAFGKALGRLRSLARWHGALQDSNRIKGSAEEEYKDCPWLADKSPEGIQAAELASRHTLREVLLILMERILPLRGRGWKYLPGEGYEGFVLAQNTKGTADAHRWICGQRGLSFARLEQLEALRKRCQALNRLLMAKPGDKVKTPREMRDNPIPDCCPDILRRLDDMKEQRVNQTANLILTQTLGVRHIQHESSAKERNQDGIHGEYEKIPDCPPAAFVVIENLSRYRFSQDRSRFENSRLMKWSHRAIAGKLKMLCEIFGIPVIEVNAAYSSKFTADGVPGFRAKEATLPELMSDRFLNVKAKDDESIRSLLDDLKTCAANMLELDSKATLLLPQDGGPLFLPFAASEWQKQEVVQADVNAAFNIGIRALASIGNLTVQNRLIVEKKKDKWFLKRTSGLGKYLSKSEEIYWNCQPGDEKLKGTGGNVFILGCPARELGRQPLDCRAERFSKYQGRMMFGGSVWYDLKRKLDICLQLNWRRLEKLRLRKK